MLYLIGLGLNEKGISLQGLESIKKCKYVYLEDYTVDFPYSTDKLEKVLNTKIIKLGRKEVESDRLISESSRADIALLIYGCPLFATTHLSLLEEAKSKKIKFKVIYSASVLDAVAETGLQLYKFGKITSLPAWSERYRPDSFFDTLKENSGVRAHSLILCDIGLNFKDAIKQLEESLDKNNFNAGKIIICSCLGTDKSRIYYNSIDELKKIKNVSLPFCIIIPSELHFLEKEFLESLSK
jgi:diphthine synthase